MSRTRRFQSLLLTLSMLAAVVIVGGTAHAVPVQGTASLVVDGSTTREVLAGAQKLLVFTVTNTGAPATLPIDEADPTINWVRISPRKTGNFTIANGSAENWTYRTVGTQEALFTDGAVGPGESGTFSVLANALSVPADKAAEWVVEVSDNNGANVIAQAPAGANALTTTIRVLNVDSVTTTAPAGVLDGTATAGQDNLVVSSVVSNHGSQALSVTPAVTSTQGGDSVGAASPASSSIAPGGTATFEFPVTLANATNNRTFNGDASATGADAINFASTSLATQAAAAFSYTNNTLQPRASVSDVSQVFTLTVAKTNIPSVNLDTTSTLTFTKATDATKFFSTNLASITSTGNGNQNVALTFAPVTIPGLGDGFDDGSYVPSLQLNGIDDNDASSSSSVSIGNNFIIDNLIPFVTATLNAPMGQLTEDGTPVVKNGNTVTFGGTIKESGAEGAALDPSAVITACDIVVKDDDGIPVGSFPVPLGNCSNSGGNITGSFTLPDLGVDSGQAVVAIVAEDAAGNSTGTPVESNFVLIDNVIPVVDRARTGCGAGAAAECVDEQTIRVFLSEAVKGEFLPVDFKVDGQVVAGATSVCTTATFCGDVTLTVLPGIEADETPGVTYSPVAAGSPLAVRTRPSDGPKNSIIDGAVTAADGILPPLPTLNTVTQSGLDDEGNPTSEAVGKQGDSFFSNQNLPTFGLTGLAADYTGLVALDTNGNGTYDPEFDQIVAECEAEGNELPCEATLSLAASASPYSLLVTSIDPGGNIGFEGGNNARLESLVIDQTAPAAGGFSLVVRAITVSFNEDLARGRDFASDWKPFAMVDGEEERYVVGSVTGSGASRDVNISETDTAFTTSIDGLRYTYLGLPSQRYRDAAGNYLGDFQL